MENKPRLLVQMRHLMILKSYSQNTVNTYIYWTKQYIRFHNKQHPSSDLGIEGLEKFLTFLAVDRQVSPATQAQALNSLVFPYREVLKVELGDIDFLRTQRRFKNIPTVLSPAEVTLVLNNISGRLRVMASLLYGAGLRVNECATLHMKDIDLSMQSITIRNAKGLKARVVPIPERLISPLQKVMIARQSLHIQDVHQGAGYVDLPWSFARKAPKAAQSLQWQYVFSSRVIKKDKKTGENRRWHCSTSTLQKAVRNASLNAQITK